MTVAEATPEIDIDAIEHPSDRAFLGNPKGLGYLAFVEGCERLSYYSMQTLLVLYMVNYLLLPQHEGGVIGLAWVKSGYGLDGHTPASCIFGAFTDSLYLPPVNWQTVR